MTMSKDIADFYLLIKTTFFTYLSMSVRSHIVEALHSFPIAKFHPASLSLLRHYSFNEFTNDLSAGLTVGVVAPPACDGFCHCFGHDSGIRYLYCHYCRFLYFPARRLPSPDRRPLPVPLLLLFTASSRSTAWAICSLRPSFQEYSCS